MFKNLCNINFGALHLERYFLWISTTITVLCTFIYYNHEGNMKPQSGEKFVA